MHVINRKALHDQAPLYLQELLSIYTPVRSLRSANKGLLVVLKYNLESYGIEIIFSDDPFIMEQFTRGY